MGCGTDEDDANDSQNADGVLKSAQSPPLARLDDTAPPRKEREGEGCSSSCGRHIRGGMLFGRR